MTNTVACSHLLVSAIVELVLKAREFALHYSGRHTHTLTCLATRSVKAVRPRNVQMSESEGNTTAVVER